MTTSRNFEQPQTHRPVATLFALVMAALAAAVLLSNFVDALHLSMARGETHRAAQLLTPPSDFRADKPVVIALARQQRAIR